MYSFIVPYKPYSLSSLFFILFVVFFFAPLTISAKLQLIEWEKTFADTTSNKELISNFMKISTTKNKQGVSQEDIQMAKGYIKKAQFGVYF